MGKHYFMDLLVGCVGDLWDVSLVCVLDPFYKANQYVLLNDQNKAALSKLNVNNLVDVYHPLTMDTEEY